MTISTIPLRSAIIIVWARFSKPRLILMIGSADRAAFGNRDRERAARDGGVQRPDRSRGRAARRAFGGDEKTLPRPAAQRAARKASEDVREDLRKLVETPKEERTEVQQYLARRFRETVKISDAKLAQTFSEFKDEYDKLKKPLADKKKQLRPVPRFVRFTTWAEDRRPAYLLVRGEAQSIGDRVAPGVPRVLTADLKSYDELHPGTNEETSGNRLALARWLTQPNHPLTVSGDGQSPLAEPFRPGLSFDAREFRADGLAAVASGIARLAGDRVCAVGVEHQGDASADDDLGGLSAKLAGRSGGRKGGPG